MSLRIDQLAAGYRHHPVFDRATLLVPSGSIVGLIGPNGAGKTTMLRIAAGLIRPLSGAIVRTGAVMYFGGEMTIPGRCGARRWARLFGASSQTRKAIGHLSRGTRQLLGLTACLSRSDWAIGLFDEPWEGLDPAGARWLTTTLRHHRERGAAIVISSHRLHDAAEICSSFAFLARGTLHPVAAAELSSGRPDAADLTRAFDAFMR